MDVAIYLMMSGGSGSGARLIKVSDGCVASLPDDDDGGSGGGDARLVKVSDGYG